MQSINQAVRTSKAYYCLECGKCSAVCPLARHDGTLLPRRLVEEAITGGDEAVFAHKLLWACLTCQRCSEICPSDVDYIGFVRELRFLAQGKGMQGHCTHGDAIFTWMELMTKSDISQDRLNWLDGDLRTSSSSEVLYFVGCLPYYEAFFKDLNVESIEVARSTVRVLNHLGVEPQVLPDERCCGHDLLWSGDIEGFRRLAQLNAALIRESGAKMVLTSCPECYRTLAVDYPRYGFDLGVPVVHTTRFLAEKLEAGELKLKQVHGTVTYQDPCRLGRHMGVYEEPRALIKALGLDLVEMAHNRKDALCCGTSCWIECGVVSRAIQEERVQEALDTNADFLITACHKCQIHFRCAMAKTENPHTPHIELKNLISLIAEALNE